jgi:hypothetical protein
MNLPSCTKIENKALNVLEDVIDDHATMSYSFNSMDKEMAWDGYIWIFKNIRDGQSKSNFDDKLPVQIKGHIDKDMSFINKSRITYPVSLEDLNIYFCDRGVLYFQIFISPDGNKREIFYSSLFPVKIKNYLEKAALKKNKKNINIPFTRLERKSEELHIVAKQFSIESRAQGFGKGQLVQNSILIKDLDKVTSITTTVVGLSDINDFLKRFSSGDVNFYGTIEGSYIKFPIEWQDNIKLFIYKNLQNAISVGGRLYYQEYLVKTDSNNNSIIMPSKNLKLDLINGKFKLDLVTGIKALARDVVFLLAAVESGGFEISNSRFVINNFNFSKGFENALKFYIELNDTLSMIEFEYDEPFGSLNEEIKGQLFSLVAIKNGFLNKHMTEKAQIYNWKIGKKYMPIIVSRHEYDEKNDLINAIYTKKHQTFITNDKNEYFKIPLFDPIEPYVLENLYYYDYKWFHEQIIKADVNQNTSNNLIMSALKLINIFDKNKEKELLELASLQMELLKDYIDEDILSINQLQIKKRIEDLADEDKELLRKMKVEETPTLCAISVLLNDPHKAKFYFDKMNNEERKDFLKYPIYHLYQEIM